MPALLVARIRLRDAEKLAAYAAATGPMIKDHGGSILRKGSFAKTLLGEADHTMSSIIEFPDVQAAENFFNSPEYQEQAEVRDAAGEMQFVLYETPPA